MKKLLFILPLLFLACSQKSELQLGRGTEVVFRQSDMIKIENIDIKRSEELCKAGDKEECYLTGTTYLMSSEIKPNFQKAGFYFTLACSLDDDRACNNLAGIYELGLGTPKDLNKAYNFYKKACDLEHKIACLNKEVVEEYLSLRKNSLVENKLIS